MAGSARRRGARQETIAGAGPAHGGAFEAEVVDATDDAHAQVRRREGPSALLPCRVAVLGYRPTRGDRVVVLDTGAGEGGAPGACIVGVLASGLGRQVTAASGATAAVEDESLILRDPSGALVAAYDPGRSTLHIGQGLARVEIGSPGGKVVLAAGDIELSAGARIAVSGPDLELTAQRASVHAEEASLTANVVRAIADEIAHTAGRWEMRVGRLMERAAEAYREAELAETRAERVRILASATYDVVAGRTTILSDDDTVIDGKRVLLG